MKLEHMEAILFDSGKVLNRPASGNWFITPQFFTYIDKETFEKINTGKRQQAFWNAGRYIKGIQVIRTKEEEYEHFRKYYEIIAKELPELSLKQDKIDALAKELVYNPEKYKFFDDALNVIPKLHQKYKLAVVSDAWPSLMDVFHKANLFHYFSSFVISTMIGVMKPNRKMYLTALEELNVSPEKAVFIDDHIRNCMGAKKLGIHAVILCRNKRYYRFRKLMSIGRGYQVIHTLDELLP